MFTNNKYQKDTGSYDLSIEGLQIYIQQLINYINENSHKYNRNLQLLKNYYQQKLNEVNHQQLVSNQEILKYKNQINLLKDVLLNKNQQITEKDQNIIKLKDQIIIFQQRIIKLQKYFDDIYIKTQQQKIKWNQKLEQKDIKIKKLEESLSLINVDIKQKNSQIKLLKDQINNYEAELSKRYSLPDQIKYYQIQQAKSKVIINNLTNKNHQIQRERDFLKVQFETIKKENQKIRIQLKSSSAQVNEKIKKQVFKLMENYEEKVNIINRQNQRLKYTLNENEIKLRQIIAERQQFQIRVKQLDRSARQLNNNLKIVENQKSSYLEEFRKLKEEYQNVINHLEETIPQYSKKNWELEQQNKQLNNQIEGMQELLVQMKAINKLNPLKKQYREWAQLEILAQRDRKSIRKSSYHHQHIQQSNTDLDDSRWKKMMLEIDNIII